MRRTVLALGATAALLAAAGPALAFGGGGSDSGSGLSPYAAESGNDRSAGVNNGNYTLPQYRAYRSYERPVRGFSDERVPRRPYYGYPY